jgi:transposase
LPRAPLHYQPRAGAAGRDPKEKTLYATERDRPDVRRKRRDFRTWVNRVARHRLIFLDEFGFNLAMTPALARAPRGQRAYSDVPFNPGRNLTLTVGLRLTGWVAPLVIPGATNGDIFTQYVRTQLAPQVHPGDIVLVDELGAHRVAAARAELRARGARLRLLPPYSPDYTPVEALGSKIKGHVRQRKPRTEAAVITAIGEALGSVTPADALAWFEHYGYCTKRKRTPL